MNLKFKFAALAGAVALGMTVAPVASYAVSYFSTTKQVVGTGTVSCGTGWRVTGGGADLIWSDSHGTTTSTEYMIRSSRPTATGWTANGVRLAGHYSSYNGWTFTKYTYAPRVWALCVR